MRKVIRWAFVSVTVLVALAVATLIILFQAARTEPKFYKEALKIQPAAQAKAGTAFEHEVLELRNDARYIGEWQAEFSVEQVNAWLAVDLPAKFPAALPPGVQDPRVALEEGLIRVAARFQDDSIETVLSFALDIQLADEPNTVAVRVRDVKAGALPVPMSVWLEKLQARIEQANLQVRWSQTDGDPVALVEIPSDHPEKPRQKVRLDSITIQESTVVLAGRTGSAENLGLAPQNKSPALVHRPTTPASASNTTSQR